MEENLNRKLDFLINTVGIPRDILLFSDEQTKITEERLKFIDLISNTINYYILSDTSSEVEEYFYSTDKITPEFYFEKNILKSMKEKGAFYTPREIAIYICQETVGRKFDEILSKIKSFISKIEITEFLELIQEFISIKILDPACGSGIFLIETVLILEEKYKQLLEIIESEIKENNTKEICFKLINPILCFDKNKDHTTIFTLDQALKHIYGMDSDPYAINAAKISIWLKIVLRAQGIIKNNNENTLKQITEIIFAQLNNNILLGDSLKKSSFYKNEFDIIIGNPPYISSKVIEKSYKQYLRTNFVTAVKQFDLYSIFIEKSFNLLKEGGKFGFIIPESFLGRSHFEVGRKLLLLKTKIKKIDKINGVFEPKVANIIIFFEKNSKKIENNGNNEIKFYQYSDLSKFSSKSGDKIEIKQDYYIEMDQLKIIFITPQAIEIIKKIEQKGLTLGDFIEIHRGEEIGKKSDIILKNPDGKINSNKIKKLLFGENISRYCIKFSHNYLFEKNILKKRNYPLYFSPKIVLRQLGKRINAAFDEKGQYVTLQTIYNIVLLKKKQFGYEYLLGILNSNLIQFYYTIMFKEKVLFPRILLENIKKIPLYIPNSMEQEKIVDLIKNIFNFKEEGTDISELQREIDVLVFNYYNLSDSEIKYILSYIK